MGMMQSIALIQSVDNSNYNTTALKEVIPMIRPDAIRSQFEISVETRLLKEKPIYSNISTREKYSLCRLNVTS